MTYQFYNGALYLTQPSKITCFSNYDICLQYCKKYNPLRFKSIYQYRYSLHDTIKRYFNAQQYSQFIWLKKGGVLLPNNEKRSQTIKEHILKHNVSQLQKVNSSNTGRKELFQRMAGELGKELVPISFNSRVCYHLNTRSNTLSVLCYI